MSRPSHELRKLRLQGGSGDSSAAVDSENRPSRQDPQNPRGSRESRPLFRLLVGIAVLTVAVWLAHVPILTAVAEVLSVEDELRPADAIFLHLGEIDSRPALAARLYRGGLARRIVLMRAEEGPAVRMGLVPNEAELSIQLLTRLGVPRDGIVLLNGPASGATSTMDEARGFAGYIRREGMDEVIVVTSDYHTRRARWALRQALGEGRPTVMMAGARSPNFDETNWWRTEEGLIVTFQEYLKFAHNWLYR